MGRQRRGSHMLVPAIYPPGVDMKLSRDVKSWHVWIMANDPVLGLITEAGCLVAAAGSMSLLDLGGRYDDANPQPCLLEL